MKNTNLKPLQVSEVKVRAADLVLSGNAGLAVILLRNSFSYNIESDKDLELVNALNSQFLKIELEARAKVREAILNYIAESPGLIKGEPVTIAELESLGLI